MTYVFDFAHETALLQEAYPKKTAKVTFVDQSAPDAKRRIKRWTIDSLFPPAQRQGLLDAKNAALAALDRENRPDRAQQRKAIERQAKAFARQIAAGIKETLARYQDLGNFMQPSHGQRGHYLLAIDVASELKCIDFGNPEKSAFFMLWHEAGHLAVRGAHDKAMPLPDEDGQSPEQRVKILHFEKCADLFALIWGIRRGILDWDDAGLLAANRACNAVIDLDDNHMTAAAIEAFMQKYKGQDFKGLSPARIAEIAAEGAESASVSQKDLRQIDRLKDAFTKALVERDRDGAAAALVDLLENEHTDDGALALARKSAPLRTLAAEVFSELAQKNCKTPAATAYCQSMAQGFRRAAP